MSPTPCLILGAAGHGAVVADALPAGSLLGFLDDSEKCPLLPHGLRRLGAFRDLGPLLRANPMAEVVIALGDNALRERIARQLLADYPTLRFATVVHATASISRHASVSPGAVICAGAVIGPGASVGSHAIVNTRASLDHHAVLGDFASMAPASATGGGASMGARSHLGMGAMLHHGISVGADTVVGSLSLVAGDLPDRVVALGAPARIVRSREPGERYL